MLGAAQGLRTRLEAFAALVDEVASDSYQQELEEEWSLGRVAAGESTNGVFPISPERRPEFEAWLANREGSH